MAPTPAQSFLVVSTAADTSTLTTASFTPAIGDVIVVKAMSESVATSAATPTDTSGNTWAAQLTDSTAAHCYGALSTTTVTVSASLTVSTAWSGSAGFHSMIVERWTGAVLAATPATNGTKTGTGAPSSTITTTAPNSAVSWANGDFAAVSPAGRTYNTTSATPTEDGIHDKSTGNYVAEYAWQNAVTPGSQTFGLTAPTGETWTLLAIEILAVSPGDEGPQIVPMFLPTLTYDPLMQGVVYPMRPWQRRFQWATQPWLNSDDAAPSAPAAPAFVSDPPRQRPRSAIVFRRSRIASPPFVQALAPAPPMVATQVRLAHRRAAWRRRGAAVSPSFVQLAAPPAPAYVQDPGRHAARTALPRRGRVASAPPPQFTPPAPTRRARAAVQRRRPVLAPPVPPQAVPPPVVARARRSWPWRRRPVLASPVPAQVAAPAAPQYPVTAQRPHRTMTGARRATTPTPVPPQAAAVPPPAYPAWVFRTHRVVTGLRRSRAPAPVPPQATAPAAPVYVPQLRAVRRLLTAPRRGRSVAPPIPQEAAPPRATARRRVFAPLRRSRAVVVVPPQIVVAPPAYPRQPVRHRIVALLLRRPGRLRFPVQPGNPNTTIPKAPQLAPGTRPAAGGAPGTRSSSSGLPGAHASPASEPGTRAGAAIEPGTRTSPTIEGGA